MTKITLHGILAKEFKKTFNLAIKKPREVFDAISCSHENFRNRIVELANQGIHFTLLVDGKKLSTMEELSIAANYEKIDIVPLVCGAGKVLGVILMVVGAVLMATGVGGPLGAVLFSTGLSMVLAPKPKVERPKSDVSGAKESFIFSSKANISEQGIPVPVGYGRLRVGSAVIQSTIKSYPISFDKGSSLNTNGQSINNNIP